MTEGGEVSKAAEALRWYTVYHEAGHAVVAMHLHVPFDRVAIITDANARGFGNTRLLHAEILKRATRPKTRNGARYIHDEIIAIFAGELSARKFRGDNKGWVLDAQGHKVTTDSQGDEETVKRITTETLGCTGEAQKILLDGLRSRARSLVELPRTAESIRLTAGALFERGQLSAKDVRSIYYSKKVLALARSSSPRKRKGKS